MFDFFKQTTFPKEGHEYYVSIRNYSDDQLIEYLNYNMRKDITVMPVILSEILRRMNERKPLLQHEECSKKDTCMCEQKLDFFKIEQEGLRLQQSQRYIIEQTYKEGFDHKETDFSRGYIKGIEDLLTFIFCMHRNGPMR